MNARRADLAPHGALRDRAAPDGAPPVTDGEHDRVVDHVWSNVRVFLPGGRFDTACVLGAARLGPHVGELADRAWVVGGAAEEGATWTAAEGDPSASPFEDGTFDLVVVDLASGSGSDPDGVLREARRIAGPSASIVVATAARRDGARVARLGHARRVTRLVALPNARRPAVLVDTTSREPGRYFMRSVAFPYRAPGRRTIKARATQLRNAIAMSAPASLAMAAAPARVTVIANRDAADSVLDDVRAFVTSSWGRFGLPGRAPERLAPLVIGHRKTTTALVSVILFGGDGPVVAKFPRYGGDNPALGREDATLRRVRERIRGDVRETIPRPLGVHRLDGTDVLLQTVVPGRHLVALTATKRLTPQLLRRQLDLMFGWSRRLQAASGRWVVVDDDLIEEHLGPLARAAVETLDGDRRVRALLERAIEDARRLAGTRLRLGVVHGDFWAGNVLVEGGRVSGVVDWERAAGDGLPIWDPVKAVLDAAYHLDRYREIPRRGPAALPGWGDLGPWSGSADPRCAVGFRAAMTGSAWLPRLAERGLIHAFLSAGIPVGWLPVAIPFHLVREFVHADVSERSVASWGSVLRAMAEHPGTWADGYAGDRRGERTAEPTSGSHDASGARGERG